MSATRDSSQKFKFVYSNLYQIYRKGKDAAKEADVSEPVVAPVAKGLTSGKVLKAEDLRAESPLAAVRVNPYTPAELLGPRLAAKAAPATETVAPAPTHTLGMLSLPKPQAIVAAVANRSQGEA